MKMNSFEIDVDRGIVANFENEFSKFATMPLSTSLSIFMQGTFINIKLQNYPLQKKKKKKKKLQNYRFLSFFCFPIFSFQSLVTWSLKIEIMQSAPCLHLTDLHTLLHHFCSHGLICLHCTHQLQHGTYSCQYPAPLYTYQPVPFSSYDPSNKNINLKPKSFPD
jgi:hypothetical protein